MMFFDHKDTRQHQVRKFLDLMYTFSRIINKKIKAADFYRAALRAKPGDPVAIKKLRDIEAVFDDRIKN